MTSYEIRKAYLDYFANKGHKIIPSALLVPENDPSTLFTGSGMQPMVPYLLGQKHPQGTRVADSQKCFRAQDIEEVGDNRHTTFFEMLGNWSLGDYFKAEQIPWMFEFLTTKLKLDPARIFVTVFKGNEALGIAEDTEAIKLWQEQFATVGIEAAVIHDTEKFGLQNGRIFTYSEKKNWWSRSGIPDKMPEGEPGGPDTEMFWDFGADLHAHELSAFKDTPCHVNCDCGRFMEIGNNVFMQYKKIGNGFEELPQKNVDFGGGLERLAAAVNDDPDMFTIDLFSSARKVIENLSGKSYYSSSKDAYKFRVILDHLRAATFLIGDQVLPSNKDQGYFVRRLIRRAVRFANQLGLKENICSTVAWAYIQTYQDYYFELAEKKEMITSELDKEEARFRTTLEKGIKEFEKIFTNKGSISGTDAFNLYQSFGFPWELTEEMAREKGQNIDKDVFLNEFKKHQELSRTGAGKKFAGGLADHSEQSTKYHTATHLLHKALKLVLGDHVEQRGSNITQERLRFDFSHPQKMTEDEIKKVEAIVNEQIKKNLPVHFEVLTVSEAKERGAVGLFEDKYAELEDKIKVYFVGNEKDGYFSTEICGGPHVEKLGSLGHFQINKEEASSAQVRRIKAILT